MRQSNYDAIDAAIDRHANGTVRLSNGKITHVNIAKEAQVGRATLYRSFDEHATLREKFETLKKNGANKTIEPPQTLHEAFLDAKEEVKRLRRELDDERRRSDDNRKLCANMIFVLKRRVQVLETENANLRTQHSVSQVITLPLRPPSSASPEESS